MNNLIIHILIFGYIYSVIEVMFLSQNDEELETMKWLIDIAQEVTDTPIAVDSPNVHTCVEAMKFCKRSSLFNSVPWKGISAHRVLLRV